MYYADYGQRWLRGKRKEHLLVCKRLSSWEEPLGHIVIVLVFVVVLIVLEWAR